MAYSIEDELSDVTKLLREKIEKLGSRYEREWKKVTPEERKASKDFLDNHPIIKEAREKAKAAGIPFNI